MKLLVIFSACLSAFVFSGCQTTPGHKPSVSTELVAQAAIQIGVMKVVENNPTHASRIVEISKQVREAVGADTSVTVAAINALIRSKIDMTKLMPSDKLVVDLLLAAISSELNRQIGDGILNSEQVVLVGKVAGWIESAAQAAGGADVRDSVSMDAELTL